MLLLKTSLATKDALLPFLVLATMVGFLIADVIEYFVFKRFAPTIKNLVIKRQTGGYAASGELSEEYLS